MQVIELSHPLKSHYLTILRNENTNSEEFRSYATKLSYLLFIEGTKNISLKEKNITTPLVDTKGYEVENDSVAISVLRAGLGLIDGVKEAIKEINNNVYRVYRNSFSFNDCLGTFQ